MGTVIVVVTCDLCGQSWHRGVAIAEQLMECVFCGSQGRLHLGPVQSDGNGTQHVTAWLQCAGVTPQ